MSFNLVYCSYSYVIISLFSHASLSLPPSRIAEYATHKYASNVLKKAFKRGDPVCQSLIDEVLAPCNNGNSAGAGAGVTPLHAMVVHEYANYVVQTMLSAANQTQRPRIIECIKKLAPELRKNDYSKRILSKTVFKGDKDKRTRQRD
jgi:hypothetical protein